MDYLNYLGVDIHKVKIENLTFKEYETKWFEAIESIKEYKISRTEYVLHEALKEGKKY